MRRLPRSPVVWSLAFGLTVTSLLSCSGSPKASSRGTGGAGTAGSGPAGSGGAATGGAPGGSGGQGESGGAANGGGPGSGGNTGGDIGTGGARSGGAGGSGAAAGAPASGGAAGGGGGTATGGGAGGTASGGAGGAGGNPGTGGIPVAISWCLGVNTIDKFEEGTGKICQNDGRTGSWFSYRDPNSTLSPSGTPTVPSTLDPPRTDSSRRALHISGTFAQYAGVGCMMKTAPQTYNASAFTGVQFYVKGTASAPMFIVQTSATESTAYGGQCALATLSCAGNTAPIVGVLPNEWTLFTVPFSTLANGTAPFNSADIWSIEFQPGPGVFDLWIDDLSFY